MSLKFKFIFLLVLFNGIIFYFSVMLLPQQTKIDIRFAIFSKFVSRDEFIFEQDKLLKLKTSTTRDFLSNKFLIKDPLNFGDLLNRVLSYFKPYKSSKGCGQFSSKLDLSIINVLNGNGCCSDFSQVFLALSNLNKLPSCELNNSNHTFNEVLNPENAQKIWLDVENKLIAKDNNGKLLSSIEIYDNFRLNNKIHLYSINHKGDFIFVSSSPLFNKKAFEFLILSNNKDVEHEDEFNNKYYFLPSEFRQVFYIINYNYPAFYIFDEKGNFTFKLISIRILLFIYLFFLLIVNCIVYKFLLKNIR